MSLMETVIALTMLALAGLAMINLLPGTWLAARTGEEKLFAANLAQSQLDQARYNWQPVATYNITDSGIVYTTNTTVAPGTQCSDPSPTATLQIITVQVSWPTQRGVQTLTRKVSACNVSH